MKVIRYKRVLFDVLNFLFDKILYLSFNSYGHVEMVTSILCFMSKLD